MISQDQVKKLFEKAKQERLVFEPELIEIFDLVWPEHAFKQDLTQETNQIDRSKQFDTTATAATDNLRTQVTKYLIPQTANWASISIRDNFPNAKSISGSLKNELASATRQLNSFFIDSNFYEVIDLLLIDGIVGGTYCLQFHDVPDEPLSFIPIPIDEIYILADKTKARIDCVFRKHMMTARQLSQKTTWKLPRDIADCVDTNPNKKFTIIESVIPNGDGKFDYSVTHGSRYDIIYQAEMELSPFVVGRWATVNGSVWGTSPCRRALPDISMINRMMEQMIISGEYAAFGIWQAGADTFGDLPKELEPRSVVPIQPGSDGLKPVEFPGQFQLAVQMADRVTQAIKNNMLVSDLPDPDQASYMKSAVIQFFKERFQALIGGPALKLQKEFLEPVAQQTAARLLKRGELRVIDLSALKSYGIDTQVQSLSTMFRIDCNAALKKLLLQEEATSSLQVFTQLAQVFGPQLAAIIIDPQKMARDICIPLGLNPEYLRDDKTVQAMLQALAGQMMQSSQTQAANGQAQGEPNGNLVDVQSLITAFQGQGQQNQTIQ